MKLLLVIEHFDAAAGGAEGFAVGLTRRLVARGHEFVVVAEDGQPMDGVDLRLGPLAATAARATAAVEPDLVLDWGLQVPADMHRLGGGTHREYLRLSQAGRSLPSWWIRRLGHVLMRKHRRIVAREYELLTEPRTHVLAVSEFVAQQVRHTARVPVDRITVLHNGVDTARFAPEATAPLRQAVRAELGLNDGDVVFLFVGHNLGLKNLALCARVFRRLHAELPQARLVVAGKREPPWRAPWARYAGAGRQPERFYAAADVLLHPTYFDACANVVLEALACGLPVVSSDRNGSAELITPDREGFVLPVCGDGATILRQWQDAVRQLTCNAELRHRLGSAARCLAEDHSLERYTAAFETVLDQCLTTTLRLRAGHHE